MRIRGMVARESRRMSILALIDLREYNTSDSCRLMLVGSMKISRNIIPRPQTKVIQEYVYDLGNILTRLV